MRQNRKNVILLHLESISRANLWQYRNELGTVWRLMSLSMQFTRFFTASTSTEMTAQDVINGDASVLDACTAFKLTNRSLRRAYPTIARDGRAYGYKYLNFCSTPYSPIKEIDSEFNLFINTPDVTALLNKALAAMADCKANGRNFFAYFWDDSSHLAYVSPYKQNASGVPERLRVAYALVDASLNRLLAGLAELGLWDDTIIVGFGDHGDEAWSHDLNRGYCHSTPPYASVTWTPMFIFNPSLWPRGGLNSQLASSVDIRQTVLSMMRPDIPPVPVLTPFAGIDLFREKRRFAFSQNMFALQREREDPERGMIKGYAVTDGDYRLVVSSGGSEPGKGGMGLYCDQADPANSLNLLRFFSLDEDGNIQRFAPPSDATARHFSHTFTPSAVDGLIEAYSLLRPTLRAFVRTKEETALAELEAILTKSPEELAKWYIMSILGEISESVNAEYLDERVKAWKIESVQQAFRDNRDFHIFPDNVFTMVKKNHEV